jgi:hypothetical protein
LQEIANIYNARSRREFRSVAALKQKYNNLKKGAKERASASKLTNSESTISKITGKI